MGAGLDICLENGTIHATVDSCQQDPYGFVVEITVNLPGGWFPTVYCPTNLLPKDAAFLTVISDNLPAKQASGE